MKKGAKGGDSSVAYDRYINYKSFSIAAGLFKLIVLLSFPSSMLDVAVEYPSGRTYALDFFYTELFKV